MSKTASSPTVFRGSLPYLADGGAIVPSDLDLSDFKEFFEDYKKKRMNRPDLMISQGLKALKRDDGCGVSLELLHEALFHASCEVGDVVLAKSCLGSLLRKFPDSVRVGILSGRFLELSGEYEKALTKYTELLTKDMSNITIMKRKVCCYKQMRNQKKTIETLHEILQTYSADTSCWYELYELYTHHGDYEASAYCCEEIVMLDPSIASNHHRLADVYYTLGSSSSSGSDSNAKEKESLRDGQWAGSDNAISRGTGNFTQMDYLLLARKHYTLGLERQGPEVNTHGLYGLSASAKLIKEKLDGIDEKSHAAALNSELYAFAQRELKAKKLNYI